MFFIAILIAIAAAYFIQMKIYEKHSFTNLEYGVTISAEEVFEGEDIFMYEEITNDKPLPLPNAKVSTELPEGLEFCLTEVKGENSRDIRRRSVQSVFVLNPFRKIKRRWRVTCNKRGVYHLGNVIIVTNELFGVNAASKRYVPPQSRTNRVVVLPKPIDLRREFRESDNFRGDISVKGGLLTDPLRLVGTREYTSLDPMNKINWMSTARQGKLMVNIEEATRREQFNILLNMQSRSVEKAPYIPGEQDSIELCITVCASIMDCVAADGAGVKLFANTLPDSVSGEPFSTDEIGLKILATKTFRGKYDTIAFLRLLAAIEMKISCPINRTLDYIAQNPAAFAGGGNLVVVTSYIDEGMIRFHRIMKNDGIHVAFYVTTYNRNAAEIPSDIEIHYKLHI